MITIAMMVEFCQALNDYKSNKSFRYLRRTSAKKLIDTARELIMTGSVSISWDYFADDAILTNKTLLNRTKDWTERDHISESIAAAELMLAECIATTGDVSVMNIDAEPLSESDIITDVFEVSKQIPASDEAAE